MNKEKIKEGEMSENTKENTEPLFMKYFVLNPNKKDIYGLASRNAMVTYARTIEEDNPKMSMDLLNWVHGIEVKLLREDVK